MPSWRRRTRWGGWGRRWACVVVGVLGGRRRGCASCHAQLEAAPRSLPLAPQGTCAARAALSPWEAGQEVHPLLLLLLHAPCPALPLTHCPPLDPQGISDARVALSRESGKVMRLEVEAAEAAKRMAAAAEGHREELAALKHQVRAQPARPSGWLPARMPAGVAPLVLCALVPKKHPACKR